MALFSCCRSLLWPWALGSLPVPNSFQASAKDPKHGLHGAIEYTGQQKCSLRFQHWLLTYVTWAAASSNLLTFYPARVCFRCWVRGPFLVIKNFAHPFQLFLQRLMKPKTWLVDSSCLISSYLDFFYFLLVKSSFSEIVLKTDVGLCSSTSLCNCWVLDVEARVSELLLPKKLLRPPKIVFKYYLTYKLISFFTWLILIS